jgi:hypothetical protein
MWYGPVGVGCESPNFQPSTVAHHAFVASGFSLASSVCVITPFLILGAAAAAGLRAARFAVFFAGFRAAFFFTAFFLVAMPSSS